MMYIVYAFHSPKYAKIYIGYTSNLEQRMHFHNKLGTKGWTIKYRPLEVIHTEEFEKKAEAIKREKRQ
ncbi:MAG TPA: GIY-YIG nuclease family protein [Fodinibius sp.]|nr:GIY-YIG nuclease family protein [Fodinibius sp.]